MIPYKNLLAALCVFTALFTAQGAFAAPQEKDIAKADTTSLEASSTQQAQPSAESTENTKNTAVTKEENKKEQMAGMKNPLHLCETVNEANKILGYRPLYVPRIYGYEVDKIYVIADAMAQLSFVSNIDDSTLIVRTAVISDVGTDEISGYYGVTWQERPISRSHTLYGVIGDKTQIVSWVEGRYAFSVICINLDEQTFMRQMKGLVRTSEQRYNRRARQ